MKNIYILTSIEPNKQNKGGPSGLIWECIKVLEMENINYQIKVIKNKNFLNKLGIYIKKYDSPDLRSSDIILVYPFNLFFILPYNLRKKTIVLGPDSPSLLFERLYRHSFGPISKFKNFILKKWFLYQENRLIKTANKFVVVGKNDSRWLRKKHLNRKADISYLTHPILQDILNNKTEKHRDSKFSKKSIVFAGDMSKKYTYKYIIEFSKIINNIPWDILIIGKNNKWIFDLFSSITTKNNIYYIEWIDNYTEICNPKFHVHIIPLVAGAGTKNRTLTACATGVTIISTPIGLENILYGKPVNKIFKFKTISDIVDLIRSDVIFNESPINTDDYIKNVNNRFKKEFLEILGIKNDIN